MGDADTDDVDVGDGNQEKKKGAARKDVGEVV